MTPYMIPLIDEMEQTEGWEIVKSFLEDRIKFHKDQLIHCPLEEVTEHRTSLKAYNSVFLYIQDIKNQEE